MRPGIVNTGTEPKKSLNRSEFMVADVTMSFKSVRRCMTFFMIPNSTSVFRDRSCASSMIITEYCSNAGSLMLSRSRIPSVMYLIFVAGDVQSSNRIA